MLVREGFGRAGEGRIHWRRFGKRDEVVGDGKMDRHAIRTNLANCIGPSAPNKGSREGDALRD